MLDSDVGLAWTYTGIDLNRECAEKHGWRRGATYLRYVAAFASLLVVALWRHETQRAGLAAWRGAIEHAWRVWRQGLGLTLLAWVVVGSVTGAFEPLAGLVLGAVYAATLVGSLTVGLGVQVWFPSGRVSAPLPLSLRVRATAAMAVWVLLLMGQVFPLVVRLLSGAWSYGPIGLDAYQRTAVENLMLTAAFIAQGELSLAFIVLPTLTLPFVISAATLCAPFVAHGVEHRWPRSNAITGVTLALLTTVQLALLVVVVGVTFAGRWPVAALIGQCLLATIMGVAATRGLRTLGPAAHMEGG